MNTYRFEEIQLNQEEKFNATVTEEDMIAFAKITGDLNPLHCDLDYAKNRGYSGKVVYGMLTSAYLSTLAGMYIPGERSLIHEVEVKLTSPLIIDGTANITVSGKVIEINETFERIIIKVLITDDKCNKILKGKMKVGVFNG